MNDSTQILLNALRFYARNPEQCRNRAFPDMPGNPNDWNAEICCDGGHVARVAIRQFEMDQATQLTIAKAYQE